MNAEAVVARYKSLSPTRRNSRDLVNQLSVEFGESPAKVRRVLIAAGAYIALPRDKARIQERDVEDIVKELKTFQYPEDDSTLYKARGSLFEKLQGDFGYSWNALFDFAHGRGLYPQTKAEREHDETVDQERLAQGRAFKAGLEQMKKTLVLPIPGRKRASMVG